MPQNHLETAGRASSLSRSHSILKCFCFTCSLVSIEFLMIPPPFLFNPFSEDGATHLRRSCKQLKPFANVNPLVFMLLALFQLFNLKVLPKPYHDTAMHTDCFTSNFLRLAQVTIGSCIVMPSILRATLQGRYSWIYLLGENIPLSFVLF